MRIWGPKNLILAALLFSQTATAAPVEWTFTDVVFHDGGTLAGSFFWDTANPEDIHNPLDLQYNSQNWLATYGNQAPRLFYSVDQVRFTQGANELESARASSWDNVPTSYGAFLYIAFDSPLGDSSSNVSLNRAETYIYQCIVETDYTCEESITLNLVSGSVTSNVVPIPGALWLLGSAVALLSVMRKRVAV